MSQPKQSSIFPKLAYGGVGLLLLIPFAVAGVGLFNSVLPTEDFDSAGPAFTFLHFVEQADGISTCIFWLLVTGFGGALGIIVDRTVVYHSALLQTNRFVGDGERYVLHGRLSEALPLCETLPQSHLARIFQVGVETFYSCRREGIRLPESLEIAHHTLQREQNRQRRRLEKGLGILRTLISVAPLLGMLGMVTDMHHSLTYNPYCDGSGIWVVSYIFTPGLTLALFGLLIGVPSLWMYHRLKEKAEQFRQEMETGAEDLLVYFRKCSQLET